MDTCGNIQDFSEDVEEIPDIFKRMVTFLKICLLKGVLFNVFLNTTSSHTADFPVYNRFILQIMIIKRIFETIAIILLNH